MVRLLTIATVLYAGVLVLVLAAVLSTVAVQLWLISRALGQARTALAVVAERTAPLRDHLSGVTAATERDVQRIEDAVNTIESALDPVLMVREATTS